MRVPKTGKRLLALSAAAALGASSIAIAGPATAAPTATATATATETGKAAANANAKEDKAKPSESATPSDTAKSPSPSASATTKAKGKSATFQAAAAQAFDNSKVAAVGFGADGQVVVQTVGTKLNEEKTKEFSKLRDYVENDTDLKTVDDKIDVQKVASPYKAMSGKSADFPSLKGDPNAKKTTVVAGAGYASLDSSGSGSLCSVGFPATDSKGNDVLISAGHCGYGAEGNSIYLEKPSTAEANGGTEPDLLDDQAFGKWKHVQYGPNSTGKNLTPAKAQDFSVISVDKKAGYKYAGSVTQWSKKAADSDNLASDAKKITGVRDVTKKDIGKSVYHSGRTTGKKSGTINQNIGIVDGYANVQEQLPDGTLKDHYVYGFGSNTPVDHGDSGGAVMMGSKAVGVVSGGSPGTLWTAELHEGLKHLGGSYKIKTNSPTKPPKVSPKLSPAKGKVGSTTTVSGLGKLNGKKVDVVFHSKTAKAADNATVKNGKVSVKVPKVAAGKHKVAVTSANGKTTYGTSSFTVVKKAAKPAPSATLSVQPKKIAAKDFVDEKKGVTLAVKNLKAGATVDFKVTPQGSGVTPYTYSAKANSNGVARWAVYGTSDSKPSVYVGKYSVSAAVDGGKTFNSGFEVVSGSTPNPGGGDDNGGDNGNKLPKTGIELGGLAAGVVLLLVGGAAVVISRRRKNQG